MLDLKFVTENLETVTEALQYRVDPAILSNISQLAEQRRSLMVEIQDLRAQQNAANNEIKAMFRQGKGDDVKEAVDRKRGELKALSDTIKEREPLLKETEDKIAEIMLAVPNLPGEGVPAGADESANQEVRRHGEPRVFDFEIRDHVDIGEGLGILDFERAAKLSGSRFAVSYGDAARMEHALIQFFLTTLADRGYTEVLPPFLVNRKTMTGTGQLPKFEEDLFKVAGEKELFLVPTAEVPVTNLHADEILPAGQLPRRYCAFSSCFRAEAGSYGRDMRGLIRMHQFQKVEMIKFATPETSYDELESMVGDAEYLLQALGLPYRVMLLSSGDMGFSAAKCYDLEVWLPSQNMYREISSCSNCTDFQARRMKIRYKNEQGKNTLVHTLNGSGLAVGRTLVAIFENYQQADGSVIIPEALRPFMGGKERIAAL